MCSGRMILREEQSDGLIPDIGRFQLMRDPGPMSRVEACGERARNRLADADDRGIGQLVAKRHANVHDAYNIDHHTEI